MTQTDRHLLTAMREARSADPATEPISSRIADCEAKSYHLSQEIQPHGVFLAIDSATLRIKYFSDNLPSTLSRPARDLLDSDIRQFLPERDTEQLLSQTSKAANLRSSLTLTFCNPPITVDALIFRSNDLACIEFEAPNALADEIAPLSTGFFELIERITQFDGASSALPSVVCDCLRAVTGFNRVYYCPFDEESHGHVLGESRDELLPSLLDHRFPATDIPQAARRMFVVNPFRLIPDVDAIPLPIVGAGTAPLDLTLSACRAVASSHLQYVRNMGVKASFSFSVVQDGRLAAIFGGHHADRRRPSWRGMAIGRHLVELFKSRHMFLQMQEESRLLAERLNQLYELADISKTLGYDMSALVRTHHAQLCLLMDADDMIGCFDGTPYARPPLAFDVVSDLLSALKERTALAGGLYRTDCLARLAPRFAALCPDIAGALAIAFDTDGRNVIVWLRREEVVQEKWSGDPHQAAIINDHGVASPRLSFRAYQRTVKGTSRRWPAALLDLTQYARQVFVQILASSYESRMRRAAEQSNALKSEFVANISHELRSPMHSIVGFADLLVSSNDRLGDEKRRLFASAIQDSGNRLLRLINDLLDLSKLEANRFELSFAEADVNKIVHYAVREAGQLASSKSLQIIFDDHQLTHRATFDAARMTQVVVNLLSNAIRFSPEAGTVTISLRSDHTHWNLEVADEGVGIPDDELDVIFDKFTQSSRTKNGAGGTGLGLTIGRELVEAHGGRIWAAGEQTRGARLVVEMPNTPQPKSRTGTEP
jgi:light-regulated signal transduction histidine kinase (bacteriophytochrome)